MGLDRLDQLLLDLEGDEWLDGARCSDPRLGCELRPLSPRREAWLEPLRCRESFFSTPLVLPLLD